MRSRKLRRNVLVLAVLGVATLLLVSVETGSDTRFARVEASPAETALSVSGQQWHGAPWATEPGALAAGGSSVTTGTDATGPANRADGRTTPRRPTPSGDPAVSDALAISPYRFRLGLINGTRVEPDARDWAARTSSSGPLLLFLPATGHVPVQYETFLTTAAEAGYHVLGLDFFNRGKAVAAICGTDAQCYTQVQSNRLTGGGPNKFSKVDAANGVVSRLHAALAYLQTHDPHGGWDQFATKDSIAWSRIVVSGHSQGGGEASYIAHEHEVRGQLTFASPIITDADVRASWLNDPSRTPADRMYAFDSVNDQFFPRIRKSWQELGLPGPILTATVPVPSDGSTHRLLTTLPLGNGDQSHLRTVTDATPLDASGDPVFAPVWRWLLARFYVDAQSPAAVAERAAAAVEKADAAAKAAKAADGATATPSASPTATPSG